jgi:hypothetical protein
MNSREFLCMFYKSAMYMREYDSAFEWEYCMLSMLTERILDGKHDGQK